MPPGEMNALDAYRHRRKRPKFNARILRNSGLMVYQFTVVPPTLAPPLLLSKNRPLAKWQSRVGLGLKWKGQEIEFSIFLVPRMLEISFPTDVDLSWPRYFCPVFFIPGRERIFFHQGMPLVCIHLLPCESNCAHTCAHHVHTTPQYPTHPHTPTVTPGAPTLPTAAPNPPLSLHTPFWMSLANKMLLCSNIFDIIFFNFVGS